MEFLLAAACAILGIWLAKKALTSRNESVIAYAGVSALVLLSFSMLLLALYIAST